MTSPAAMMTSAISIQFLPRNSRMVVCSALRIAQSESTSARTQLSNTVNNESARVPILPPLRPDHHGAAIVTVISGELSAQVNGCALSM